MLAIKLSAWSQKLALGYRATDFGTLGFGIDYPNQLGTAAKEIAQTRIDLGASIVWRKDSDSQIGGSGKKLLCVGLEAEALQTRFGYKGNVRCPAISVEHPMAGI